MEREIEVKLLDIDIKDFEEKINESQFSNGSRFCLALT